MKPTIHLDLMEQAGQELLRIRIPWDPGLIREVKKIPDIRWSVGQRAWLTPYREQVLPLVEKTLKTGVNWDDSDLKERLRIKEEKKVFEEVYASRIRRFEDWMISKRYSPGTQKTYADALRVFLQYMGGKPVSDLVPEDLIRFNKEYILRHGYSASYQNQVVNALKLFLRVNESALMMPEMLPRPRSEKKLPNVLSKEEVRRILDAPQNLKHRVMLSLLYACGLRRSELLNLKLTDLQSDRGLVLIRQSKGKKDRFVPLSPKLLASLREYYMRYRPKLYLFEGQNGGQYSEKSIQLVLKQALTKAGIVKPATLHWLRHSYATHLLESGTDLRYIQELPGHNSSRTTEIYTHVSKRHLQQIKSPYDDL